MPTFICQELFNQCNTQNIGNKKNQDACITNIRDHCGKQDPTKATAGGSDSGSSTTAGSSGSATTTSPQATSSGKDGESNSSKSSHGMAAPTMAPGQGMVAAAAAVGVFAYLL